MAIAPKLTGPCAECDATGPAEWLIVDFLAYMELERGLSRNTLEAYRSDLLQLAAFLHGADLDVLEVTHAELAPSSPCCPRATRSTRRSPAATLARKVACVRSFYRHLRMEGVIEHDPTAELRGTRASAQRLPRVLSRDQVGRLLASPRGSDPLALRDRALLELMYACGLRASEAIGLELARRGLRGGRCCAPAGRAPRSGSCRSAAARWPRSPPTAGAAGRRCSVRCRSRGCSSTAGERR